MISAIGALGLAGFFGYQAGKTFTAAGIIDAKAETQIDHSASSVALIIAVCWLAVAIISGIAAGALLAHAQGACQ